MNTESPLQRKLRENRGEKLRTTLRSRIDQQGVPGHILQWRNLDDTDRAVERWKAEFSMEAFGKLAFTPPETGTLHSRAPIGKNALSVATGHGNTLVAILFHGYEAMGIADAPLSYLATHIDKLAKADGNGLVAVTGDMHGVLLADLDDTSSTLTLSRWGNLASLLSEEGDSGAGLGGLG